MLKLLVINNCRRFIGYFALCFFLSKSLIAEKTVFLDFDPVLFHQQPKAHPLLFRELARQSFLLTAREELGMTTRDAVLKESKPTNESASSFSVKQTFNDSFSQYRVEVASLNISDLPSPLVLTLDLKNNYKTAYAEVLTESEAWSRTEFKNHLISIGANLSAHSKSTPEEIAALKKSILNLEGKLDILSQYDLIKALHQHTQKSGPSLLAYTALARAYAHLYQESYGMWYGANKVFQARALLYGQRSVALFPEQSKAYYARAYAFALTGLHADALKDLHTAGKLNNEESPKWRETLGDFLNLRGEKLVKKLKTHSSNEEPDQLTALLAILTIKLGNWHLSISDTAHDALHIFPQSLRIAQALNDTRDLVINHRSTLVGLESYETYLENVVAHLAINRSNDAPTLPLLRQKLIQEDLSAEPSSQILGHLLNEGYFTQVAARVHFMAKIWGVEYLPYLASVEPQIGEHPLFDLLKCYNYLGVDSTEETSELLRPLIISDIVPTMHLFVNKQSVKKHQYSNFSGEAVHKSYYLSYDYTADDIAQVQDDLLRYYKRQYKPLQRTLTLVSPHNPKGYFGLCQIGKEWETAYPEWLKKVPDNPMMWAIIGTRMAKAKHIEGHSEKAKYYLHKGIEHLNERWAYKDLANIYLREGNEEEWLRIMLSFLEKPPLALYHSHQLRDIGRHYMKQLRADKALPYAERAAASFAGWAMQFAAYVNCANGNKERGEYWWNNTNKRYNTSPLKKMQEALSLGFTLPDKEALNPVGLLEAGNNTVSERTVLSLIVYAQGEPELAINNLSTIFHETKDPWYAFAEGMIRAELNTTTTLRDVLIETRQYPIPYKTKVGIANCGALKAIAEAMISHLENKSSTSDLEAAMKAQRKKVKHKFKIDFDIYCGWYFYSQGEEHIATKYLKRTIHQASENRTLGFVSYYLLRKMGKDPFQRYYDKAAAAKLIEK